MEIKLENEQQHEVALLMKEDIPTGNGKPPKTPAQKVVRKTFKGTANLANLLPTGSVLIFQFFSPILTQDGRCLPANHLATVMLLSICAASCFLLCFTDSIRDDRGKVRYALAMPGGLWLMDDNSGSLSKGCGFTLSPEEEWSRRIRFIDVMHAVMSVLVFGSVALFDKNVVSCFYPAPSEAERNMLVVAPVAVGVVCSALFVAFPSRRHGVGFPLSKH